MWRLKGCPRCGGDVFLEKNEGWWFKHCLQCGYQRQLAGVVEFRKPAGRKKEPAPVGRR